MVKHEYKTIKMLDLAILLYHVHKGAQDQEIGFEDAQESLDSLTAKLNKSIDVPRVALESALWSVNLMDEQGKYWHPLGLSFDEYAKRLVGNYNRFYCTIEEKS